MPGSSKLVCCSLLFSSCTLFPVVVAAQQDVLQQRWVETATDNFVIFSQVSSRQTQRFAGEMESWRQVAADIIAKDSPFPRASVPNYVYLFDNTESFQHFTVGSEIAFFYSTPRANFMALVLDDELSVRDALHHYVHFLVKNFSDLHLPRWYEEGLAGYLSRMRINRGQAEFERITQEANESMAELSDSFSMERLFYRDAALASPRVIQIANLKSEALLHYFKHAHEEEGYPDRREQLQNYLDLLIAGRNPRFAFDQSFDVTTAQLDAELGNYLLTSRRPAGRIEHGSVNEIFEWETSTTEGAPLAVMLGELALNSGNVESAQFFFQAAIDRGAEIARSYSGLGDALRFQELEGMDQEIVGFFEKALATAPEDPNILMDYGEYWESELTNCDKTYPPSQRRQIIADITEHFRRALAILPQSPEANLAMGQLYLFPEQDWQEGIEYQRRAFSQLPADSFIMEQAIKYAIAADEYDEAERLINEMAQPIHYFGEPQYVSDLRVRLLRKRRSEPYDACALD
ncbi:MAG: hypothetical protein O2971_18200 [Proteobacteria bacterium]|nr:hypothetical protein [Pseudomonadota bacterium]